MSAPNELPRHAFPGRAWVELEVARPLEPTGMEHVRLPGGTLHYMLRLIDTLAHTARGEPVAYRHRAPGVDGHPWEYFTESPQMIGLLGPEEERQALCLCHSTVKGTT